MVATDGSGGGSWVLRLRPTVPAGEAPSASADVLARALRQLGPDVIGWAVESAQELFRELEKSANGVEIGFVGPGGIENELLSVLLQLEERRSISEFEVSRDALQDARSLARAGLPAVVLNEAVWRLHVRIQDAMQSVAAPAVADGSDLTGGEVSSAGWDDLLRLTRYSEVAARRVLEAYADEERALDRGWAAHRREVVGKLLAGERLSTAEEHALGVRLNGHHLVAVMASLDGAAVQADDARVAQLSGEVSASIERGTALVVPLAAHTLLWWSRAEVIGATEIESIRGVAVPSGLSVAFGDPHGGADGVARGYLEARRASQVAHAADDQQPWMHADVLLTTALFADPEATADLVQRELAGLLGSDAKTGDLRRTVLSFLRSGGSRQATAQELGVAPTTVAYRVESFERLRGRRLSEGRLETWVALELTELAPSLFGCSDPSH